MKIKKKKKIVNVSTSMYTSCLSFSVPLLHLFVYLVTVLSCAPHDLTKAFALAQASCKRDIMSLTVVRQVRCRLPLKMVKEQRHDEMGVELIWGEVKSLDGRRPTSTTKVRSNSGDAEWISETICEQIADVRGPQVVERTVGVPKISILQGTAEQILDVLVPEMVEQLVKLPNTVSEDRIRERTVGLATRSGSRRRSANRSRTSVDHRLSSELSECPRSQSYRVRRSRFSMSLCLRWWNSW